MFRNPSKFRNAVFTPEKKQNWISFSSNQPFIQSQDAVPLAACSFAVAYRGGITGTEISVFLLDLRGKKDKPSCIIQAGSLVNGLYFSRWGLKEAFLHASTDNSSLVYKIALLEDGNIVAELIDQKLSSIGKVDFSIPHPNASDITVLGQGKTVQIWNYNTKKTIASVDNVENVQDLSWKDSGDLFAVSGQDNLVKIFDPRVQTKSINSFTSHDGHKPTKICWAGSTDLIFTVGFNSKRYREYSLWDVRNTLQPLVCTSIDSGQGQITPLYDQDTGMVYLAGKGDMKLSFVEIRADQKVPIDNSSLAYNSPLQIVGACLTPKLSLNVMEGEVARLFTISNDSSIIPVKVTIPRKSYADFHADIFPDTKSNIAPALSGEEWSSGKNDVLSLVSLDPKNVKKEATSIEVKKEPKSIEVKEEPKSIEVKKEATSIEVKKEATLVSTNKGDNEIQAITKGTDSMNMEAVAGHSKKLSNLPKHSLYRHVLPSFTVQYEDYSPGNVTIPNETNGFKANDTYFAFIQAGPGGRIAVWPTSKTGRMPTKVIGSEINDFAFDPFSSNTLVTGCDDGKIRLFSIPPVMESDITDSVFTISAHTNRISLLLFHPTIKDFCLTSSPELGTPVVKLWDLSKRELYLTVQLGEAALSAVFNLEGTKCAVLCKDKTLLIFDLKTGKILQKGPSHKGSKAARLTWLHGKSQLLSAGFGNGSMREFFIYNENNLQAPIYSTEIDSSPSILSPVFDIDTSLLFLFSGSSLWIYEIEENGATFLNKILIPGLATTFVSMLAKKHVDVKAVEILKGYRSTLTTVELVSVTVPRVKKEYFQDDIFVDTIDYDSSCLAIEQWSKETRVSLKSQSLHPQEMPKLSESINEKTEKAAVPTFEKVKTEAEMKDASMKAMFQMALQQSDGPLAQDLQEGVADDEWD